MHTTPWMTASRRAAAFGIAGLVAAGTLSGCTSSESDATSASGSGDAEPTVFEMAWSGHPTELDPANMNLLEEYQFGQLVYETLTDFSDDDLAPEPELASEWSVSDDGLVWTFTIIDDAVFHSGKALTADDVVYSIMRLIDPDVPTAHAAYYTAIEEAVAIDDTTVELHLSEPMADLASALAQPYAAIVPEGSTAEELATTPDGTGPYVMDENVEGSMIVYKAFEDYRDQDSITLDEIHQVTIAQAETQSTSLIAGDIDLISQVSAQQLSTLEAADNVSLIENPGASFHTIYLNTSFEPLDDERVREALRLVMDREALAAIATGGLATATADNVVLSANPYHADIEVPEQNIEKAKELLAEAGYPDGFEMDIWTTTERFGLSEMTVAYAEMAAQAGITLNVVTKTNSDLGTEGYRQQPMVAFYFTGFPDGDGSISPFYESDGAYNGGGSESPYFSDDELDELITEARSTTDTEARAELYADAQEIIAERGYALVPYEMPLVTATGSDVSGFSGSAMGYYELFNVTVEG